MGTSISERVRKHRDGLRADGIWPVQMGVPDTRGKAFALECQRQSRLLMGDPKEARTLEWLGAAADTEGWK